MSVSGDDAKVSTYYTICFDFFHLSHHRHCILVSCILFWVTHGRGSHIPGLRTGRGISVCGVIPLFSGGTLHFLILHNSLGHSSSWTYLSLEYSQSQYTQHIFSHPFDNLFTENIPTNKGTKQTCWVVICEKIIVVFCQYKDQIAPKSSCLYGVLPVQPHLSITLSPVPSFQKTPNTCYPKIKSNALYT